MGDRDDAECQAKLAKAKAAKRAAVSVNGSPCPVGYQEWVKAWPWPSCQSHPADDESNRPPRDPNGYIFLGRAVDELAQARFQCGWRVLISQQRRSVIDDVVGWCEMGNIASAYSLPTGEMRAIASHSWNADDIERVFDDFTIAIYNRAIYESRPVFLSKADWGRAIGAPNPAQVSPEEDSPARGHKIGSAHRPAAPSAPDMPLDVQSGHALFASVQSKR
jgi:hypothetical protein